MGQQTRRRRALCQNPRPAGHGKCRTGLVRRPQGYRDLDLAVGCNRQTQGAVAPPLVDFYFADAINIELFIWHMISLSLIVLSLIETAGRMPAAPDVI